MDIKLNKKKHKIKPASQLTVQEFLTLSEIKNSTVIDYLAITLNVSFSSIANLKFDRISERQISAYVGSVTDISEFFETNIIPLHFHFQDRAYPYTEFDCETVGVRIMMEAKAKETDNVIELAVYLLSVLIEGQYDSKGVQKVFNRLMCCNYIDVIRYAAFFLKKFQSGFNSVPVLSKLIRKIFTRNTVN